MEATQSEIICRACLSSDAEVTFYDIHDICLDQKSYKDLLEGLSSFIVEQHEPSYVCGNCALQLVDSFKFKQTLEETQLIVNQLKNVPSNVIFDQVFEEIHDPPQSFDISTIVIEVVGKSFACMYCPKQFAKERGLFDHLNRYHRDKKTTECKLCHRLFYCVDHRDSHTLRCPALLKPKADQMLQCPDCGRFGERQSIKYHVMKAHRRKQEGPFQCDLCGIWLKSKECITNHMKAKHLNRKFVCGFCEKSYSSRSGLDLHVQQYHTKKSTYNCSLCPYKSHSKTLLRKHEQRHTNTTTFTCDICNCNFVSLDNLKRHKFVHTDARPEICEICNRGFKTKEALRKHLACHQEYRYECPNCMKKYLTNQAMRSHCTKTHPNYKLPPLGTILAADAKPSTAINTKLQKSVFGILNYKMEPSS